MKEEVRAKLKIKRNSFKGAERDRADEAIARNFVAAFSEYGSFFIYNSFGSEASTSAIIEELLKLGKLVYLPRVEGSDILPIPFGKTVKGAFGIEEPAGQAYEGEIEVTVIPLLAVNGRGYRVGYGKGYYDRYSARVKTLKVGLGYAFQQEEFEEDGWDIPLDCFACERGIVRYGE